MVKKMEQRYKIGAGGVKVFKILTFGPIRKQ